MRAPPASRAPVALPAPRGRALLAGLLALALLAAAACTPLATAPVAAAPAVAAAPLTTHAPGTAPLQALAATLAPTGELRVGVYLGSPTSLVRSGAVGAEGPDRGVSVEIGRALAAQLGVPYRQVEFARLALVLEALKAGQVDVTVTNATPARAQDMNFSPPLVALELGLLVPAGSALASVDEMDRPGHRIGVAQGSSSQAALGQRLTQARVVAAPSLQVAAKQLQAGELDGFATNKAILHEMADGLPGARILPGRWGTEHLAIAIPKGREAAMAAVQGFAEQATSSGQVQRAAERAGLRGAVPVPAR